MGIRGPITHGLVNGHCNGFHLILQRFQLFYSAVQLYRCY